MAKKTDLTNPFAKTEPTHPPARMGSSRTRDKTNRVRSIGVGLRESEWAELQQIADELGGVGLHPLMQWIIRDYLAAHRAGTAALPPVEKSARIKD